MQALSPVRWTFQSLLSWMVRAVGIEPTLLAERDFESRASTNTTTPALRHAYSVAIKTRNGKHKQRSLCCWLRGLLSCGDWRGPRFANIDGGCVDVVLQMPSVKLLDHLDTGAAVFGDLINVRKNGRASWRERVCHSV